jgi:hypothetical protein
LRWRLSLQGYAIVKFLCLIKRSIKMGVSCSLWGLIKRLTKIFLLSELAEIGFDEILPFMLGGDINLSRFASEKIRNLK